MAHDEQWLTPRLQTAATLCNQTPAATESPLWLGVDLEHLRCGVDGC